MSFLFEALVWKLSATSFIDFLAVNTERETGVVHRQGKVRVVKENGKERPIQGGKLGL